MYHIKKFHMKGLLKVNNKIYYVNFPLIILPKRVRVCYFLRCKYSDT